MTIRTDDRQWLIYDEPTVRAVEGALEMFLMALGAATIMGSEDLVLRAMGHSGDRISNTRIELWAGIVLGMGPGDHDIVIFKPRQPVIVDVLVRDDVVLIAQLIEPVD